jgi:hypothetical protein
MHACAVKVRAPTNRHTTVKLVPGTGRKAGLVARPACDVIPELAAGQSTKTRRRDHIFLKLASICFLRYSNTTARQLLIYSD